MALSQEQQNVKALAQQVGADVKFINSSLPVNPKSIQFGAIGDGVADDTAAIQSALNYAKLSGIMSVQLPAGQYVVTNTITIPAGVVLIGKPKIPFKSAFGLDYACIYVKTAKDINKNCFVLSVGAGIRGLSFYWPEQVKTAAAPFQYGWAITTTGNASEADNVTVEDIMLTNCYRGVNIDFGGQWNCRNVFGQAFDIGIRIDRMFDVSSLSRVHFWDFWAGGADAAKTYIQNNGRAVVIGRADDLKMSDIFAWGHKHAIHYTDFGSGPSWSQATNVTADNCLIPLQFDKVNIAQLVNVIAVTNDKASGRACIETSASISGEVIISNYSGYQAHTLANITSSTGVFRFNNVAARRRGQDNSDIMQYAIINQSTAKVYLDNAEYYEVAGFVQVGSSVLWSSDTDVTFSNFTTPHSWLDASGSRIASVSGGSRFALNGGISTCRIDLPQSIKDNAGVYVLECDLLLNTPANLGPGQFYLRLTDTNVNDVILPGSFINGFFVQKTHLRIPLIVRGNLTLQFVFGNASAACTMDITNMKLFQVAPYKQTRSLVDWVHMKQPNSLNQSLPAILK